MTGVASTTETRAGRPNTPGISISAWLTNPQDGGYSTFINMVFCTYLTNNIHVLLFKVVKENNHEHTTLRIFNVQISTCDTKIM
jgi:hypothetical protein